MTKSEAVEQMLKGIKITHNYFADNEWMTIKDGKILTEEGYNHNAMEFWAYRQLEDWNDGYSVFK